MPYGCLDSLSLVSYACYLFLHQPDTIESFSSNFTHFGNSKLSLTAYFNNFLSYERQQRARDDVWVFGVTSLEYSPRRGYFCVVERRDRATLTQILQRVLLPGSEVHSDDWAAHRNLHIHVPNVTLRRTVIHQYNFVDPVTGIHMQETESAWAHLKYHIKKEKGIRHGEIQDFLDEQMWRDWRGLDATFQNVIILVSNNYPL